jgi:hypothetical protein
VSGYNNLLAVTSEAVVQNVSVFYSYGISYDLSNGGNNPAYTWICEDLPNSYNCDVPKARRNAATWTISQAPIAYVSDLPLRASRDVNLKY